MSTTDLETVCKNLNSLVKDFNGLKTMVMSTLMVKLSKYEKRIEELEVNSKDMYIKLNNTNSNIYEDNCKNNTSSILSCIDEKELVFAVSSKISDNMNKKVDQAINLCTTMKTLCFNHCDKNCKIFEDKLDSKLKDVYNNITNNKQLIEIQENSFSNQIIETKLLSDKLNNVLNTSNSLQMKIDNDNQKINDILKQFKNIESNYNDNKDILMLKIENLQTKYDSNFNDVYIKLNDNSKQIVELNDVIDKKIINNIKEYQLENDSTLLKTKLDLEEHTNNSNKSFEKIIKEMTEITTNTVNKNIISDIICNSDILQKKINSIIFLYFNDTNDNSNEFNKLKNTFNNKINQNIKLIDDVKLLIDNVKTDVTIYCKDNIETLEEKLNNKIKNINASYFDVCNNIKSNFTKLYEEYSLKLNEISQDSLAKVSFKLKKLENTQIAIEDILNKNNLFKNDIQCLVNSYNKEVKISLDKLKLLMDENNVYNEDKFNKNSLEIKQNIDEISKEIKNDINIFNIEYNTNLKELKLLLNNEISDLTTNFEKLKNETETKYNNSNNLTTKEFNELKLLNNKFDKDYSCKIQKIEENINNINNNNLINKKNIKDELITYIKDINNKYNISLVNVQKNIEDTSNKIDNYKDQINQTINDKLSKYDYNITSVVKKIINSEDSKILKIDDKKLIIDLIDQKTNEINNIHKKLDTFNNSLDSKYSNLMIEIKDYKDYNTIFEKNTTEKINFINEEITNSINNKYNNINNRVCEIYNNNINISKDIKNIKNNYNNEILDLKNIINKSIIRNNKFIINFLKDVFDKISIESINYFEKICNSLLKNIKTNLKTFEKSIRLVFSTINYNNKSYNFKIESIYNKIESNLMFTADDYNNIFGIKTYNNNIFKEVEEVEEAKDINKSNFELDKDSDNKNIEAKYIHINNNISKNLTRNNSYNMSIKQFITYVYKHFINNVINIQSTVDNCKELQINDINKINNKILQIDNDNILSKNELSSIFNKIEELENKNNLNSSIIKKSNKTLNDNNIEFTKQINRIEAIFYNNVNNNEEKYSNMNKNIKEFDSRINEINKDILDIINKKDNNIILNIKNIEKSFNDNIEKNYTIINTINKNKELLYVLEYKIKNLGDNINGIWDTIAIIQNSIKKT